MLFASDHRVGVLAVSVPSDLPDSSRSATDLMRILDVPFAITASCIDDCSQRRAAAAPRDRVESARLLGSTSCLRAAGAGAGGPQSSASVTAVSVTRAATFAAAGLGGGCDSA